MNRVKFSKRKLQGMETKRRIMECAIKLFKDKGYHNVTVDEIIEKTGSSKGGFYTHFSSKEELLHKSVGMLDEIYVEFLQADLAGCSAGEKILAFIEHVFKAIEEYVGLEFIKVTYASQIKDLTPERFEITPERKYYQILEKLINEGKGKKEAPADLSVENTIRILTTGIRGVLYDWCLSNGNFNLTDYGSEVAKILLKQFFRSPG